MVQVNKMLKSPIDLAQNDYSGDRIPVSIHAMADTKAVYARVFQHYTDCIPLLTSGESGCLNRQLERANRLA